MCFTQPISTAFAIIMWTFAILWKGPTGARACVAYFAAMETLQAFQYNWLDQCDNDMNKILTVLGFFHLAFQPFFANMYLTAYMTKGQKKYAPLILALSLFGGILMCNRLWMSQGDFPCSYGIEPMCGLNTCTFRGHIHLAWQMPMQHADQDYFTPGFNMHFFLFYLPTFALGMWPLTLFLLFSGPFLGRALTQHQDEIPAIWCFFSIGQLFFPLIHAYITKTAMFARKEVKAVATATATATEAVALKGANAADDETDPLENPWTMIKRAAIFFTALTVKRYATIALSGGADMAVTAAQAALAKAH